MFCLLQSDLLLFGAVGVATAVACNLLLVTCYY